jgi:hypothetical protein
MYVILALNEVDELIVQMENYILEYIIFSIVLKEKVD